MWEFVDLSESGDGVETHFLGWCGVFRDELFDGVEDGGEILIVLGVFALQVLDFLGKELVGIHQAAELDEGAHNGDVHIHGAGRAQDGGKHGDALLGECVGAVFKVFTAL